MFRNRAIQVKMVKTTDNENLSDEIAECDHFDLEQIKKITEDLITHTAIVFGIVFATSKILSTISKIAVIKAKAKIH